jgi:predicted signal transduction protein with EAL and GGDEF domain
LLRIHEVSRTERELGTVERGEGSHMRSRVSGERDDTAAARDESARRRDAAADARDRAADALDREAGERLALGVGSPGDHLEAALADATGGRARAAADRARAAEDRRRAAEDRRRAAEDRQQASAELERAHLDELTGAYTRGMGKAVLQYEMTRAKRSNVSLVLAFVDVDGLKAVNDRGGHAAGDALLRDLAAAIRSRLRPYDLSCGSGEMSLSAPSLTST